jgi:glutamate racemase
MRIVVTDSGLGGLSVMGEMEERLKKNRIFENVELIFFNSLYHPDYGYNMMKTNKERELVFDNALNSIKENLNPDIILIACNTLSVVYPKTKFSKNTKIPVVGILESGVALFKSKLTNNSHTILLFGTPTTINSNLYKSSLLNAGIDARRIINQACFDLETKIQHDPNSIESRLEISKFLKEALTNYKNSSEKLLVGLCCTHYGFSEKIFHQELSKLVEAKVEILNPNSVMLNFIFENKQEFYPAIKIDAKLFSRVKLKQNEMNSLSSILREKSPLTANALLNYDFVEDLFDKV